MIKKIIYYFIILSLNMFADVENKFLDYTITDMNDNILRETTVTNVSLNFQVSEFTNKSFPVLICKENKKLKVEIKTYRVKNSISLYCKGSSDYTSTHCNLKFFNVDYNDKKINNMLNLNICDNYSPKEIVDNHTFQLNLDSTNEIILNKKYKFKYKLYQGNRHFFVQLTPQIE